MYEIPKQNTFVKQQPFYIQQLELLENACNILIDSPQKFLFLSKIYSLYSLIKVINLLKENHVQKIIHSIQDSLKTEKNVKKNEKKITKELFFLFLIHAGESFQRMHIARSFQLQIFYILLFFTPLKLKQCISLTKTDLFDLLEKQYFILEPSNLKVNISEEGVVELRKKQFLIQTLFEEYKYPYLGSSMKNPQQVMTIQVLIELINKDINNTIKKYNLGNENDYKYSIKYLCTKK